MKPQLSKSSSTEIVTRVKKLLEENHSLLRENLIPNVENFLKRKEDFLKIAKEHKTPCYVLDKQELLESIKQFTTAFNKYIPNFHTYFAVKTNNHPVLLETLVKNNIGLDISSLREFNMARESDCKDMIYTGPGKTTEDLLYVLENDKNIIIQIDSFGELDRLGTVTNTLKQKVKAGIRISTSAHKQWTKFGIPLKDLHTFWQQAKKFSFIDLQGIQFHLSWNEDAKPYQQAIKEIGQYLEKNFTKEELDKIKFIDFGGGFRPFQTEGFYPWETPQGEIIKLVNDYFGKKTTFKDPYFITPAIPISEYAQGIGESIKKYLSPLITCSYFAEPGRIICNSAMHILLKVIDKKNKTLVITNGGINIVGWEKFLYEYFPIINLSRPATIEYSCTIAGPLCTPEDLWGYYYYGSAIEEEDICLIPYQGHLTYSFAQNFIQPIPPVYILE